MDKLHASCVRDMKFTEVTNNEYETCHGGNYLANLTRLNVFIGPNNSGKSRLLRSLYNDEKGSFSTDAGEEAQLRAPRTLCIESARQLLLFENMPADYRTALERLARCAPPLWRTASGGEYSRNVEDYLKRAAESSYFNSDPPVRAAGSQTTEAVRLHTNIRRYLSKYISRKQDNATYKKVGLHRVYIPSMRSLHHLEEQEMEIPRLPAIRRTAIRAWFRNDAKLNTELNDQGGRGDDFDETQMTLFTGGELYGILQNRLLGDRHERERIREFENFLGGKFFSGRSVSLIPKRKTNVPSVKIGDEEERGIQFLGDGVQQIIILSLPLFLFADRPLLLFVEEPELYLHPGFQRLFIDLCLTPRHPQHQVFVATHSHQFLDITVDRDLCSVYRVTKNNPDSGKRKSFTIAESSTDDFDLLRILGVRNSSVMLSNCTIWVEGIWDRLYFRKYLQLYQEYLLANESAETTFSEDLHYSFVEYGGSNITHWSFLDKDNGIDAARVCGTLMLIADSDHSWDGEIPPKKRERHSQLADVLGHRFFRLDCREVENLLPPSIILSVIRHYDNPEQVTEFPEHSQYANRPLGQFINEFLDNIGVREHRDYQDGLTLKDKQRFCAIACDSLTSWEQCTPAAKAVTVAIYEFIKHQNR